MHFSQTWGKPYADDTMAKQINCQRCNAEILGEHRGVKYCDACKSIPKVKAVRILNCKRCNTAFEPSRNVSKYCDSCRTVAYKELRANYQNRNLEKHREYGKKWRENNQERVRATTRAYYASHREHIRVYQREYMRKRRSKDGYSSKRLCHGATKTYFYPDCEKRDCDWIESQLNAFRKENIRGDPEKQKVERDVFLQQNRQTKCLSNPSMKP